MFSFTVTPTIQKEGKVVGQAAAPPVLTTPPRSRVLCSGRPPTGRGNQVCVFSRPGAGRSAAPPRAHPAELPAASQRPADAPEAVLLPDAGAAEHQADRGLPGVGTPGLCGVRSGGSWGHPWAVAPAALPG